MKKIKTLKKINLLILFSILPMLSFSQYKVKGLVKDKDGVVAFANVVLLDADKNLKGGAITDDSGVFTIDIAAGSYELSISFIGYKSWSRQIDVTADIEFNDIVLEANVEQLEGVSVEAQRRLIEYKADRLVFNVASSVAATGGDAISALRAAPGIIIQQGNISLLGKESSRVLVDGRLVELTGSDLVNYLNSIASSDIKSIEVITTPPAKYEASGNGGLINIILKKGVRNSWKNTTTFSYDQNTFSFFTLRNNFFYNKNRFRFSLSTSGITGDVRNKSDLTVFFPDAPWRLDGDERQRKDNFSGRITFDYDITDNISAGIQYSGNRSRPDGQYSNDLTFFNSEGQIDSFLLNSGLKDREVSSDAYNAHLIAKLDTLGRQISFDVDYFEYDSENDNTFVAENFSADRVFEDVELAASNISNQDIDNFSAKIDVEHPLKFLNLSYGAKVSFVNSNSSVVLLNNTSGVPILDPDQSNDFEYEENTQAVYVSGSKSISEKLSVQLGLRFENTNSEGFSPTLNQTNINDYSRFFPSVFISYARNKNNSFILNYGKRINRPSFGNLNPFRIFINSNSFSEGNPFLQPSFSDNIDFTYVYKRKFRTNAFLNITTDGFGTVFTADPQDNTQTITRQNFFREYYFGIGESYTTNITSWWQSQNLLYLLGSETEFDNSINAEPQNNFQLFLSTNNTFSLGKSTKLQVDYFYTSPNQRGLFEIGFSSGLNLSLRQGFFKDDLQVSLLVNDVFNSAFLRDYTSIVNGIRQVLNENNSSRFFRFSMSYSFGNDKINVRKRDFGNDEERGRSN